MKSTTLPREFFHTLRDMNRWRGPRHTALALIRHPLLILSEAKRRVAFTRSPEYKLMVEELWTDKA